jgi:uncharacterized phage protein (TIGR01671 family)
MNRTIKFRGKRINSERWTYGFYTKSALHGFEKIRYQLADYTWTEDEVAPETVGQFTGFFDESGEEVYEGDIIFFEIKEVGIWKMEIIFTDGAFKMRNKEKGSLSISTVDEKYYRIRKVLGNIHDNKDLLTTKE